jgi:ABC-type multidrug transport system ATPase subunit/ABC-type multidrug transport system permease subunit
MAAINKKIEEKGDFEILLGSSPDCDYALTGLEDVISPKHAALKRAGDRLFLKDLKSDQGTFINGRKIRNRWHEITLNDNVLLGNIPLEIKPRILLGRDRVGLEARHLFYEIPDRSRGWFKPSDLSPGRRTLTDDVSVSAEPGTLTGIMGPSGAGKTVLLNLMSGHLKPYTGSVTVGDFNVHKSFGLIKDIIGYVPQDDTLIPELEVSQSLHYCLRLGYPNMESDVRQTLIEDVLIGMGFTENRLDKLLNTQIGSAERRGLSGGERKRVNIAHELVRNPLLLFIDEPTSGLSSVDSEQVVSLLKDICNEKKVTMLMTIHQPSRTIFRMLDNLLLLNVGGKVAYFGPAAEVVTYFRAYSEEPADGNPAEYVLRVLANKKSWKSDLEPEMLWQNRLEKHKAELPEEKEGKKSKTPRQKKYHLFHQFFLLMRRNIRIRLSDKASLALLLFQSLIIASLLLLTFKGFESDYINFDRFARTWFHFITKYERSAEREETLFAEPAFRDSLKLAEENRTLIGEHSAQRRASVLFLLIAAAIWFGVVNAAREIVSEKSVMQRETRAFLCIFPYLAAKVFILSMIAVIQTGILLSIACYLIPLSASKFFLFWSLLTVTSIAGSCLSLFISSAAETEQFSLMAVPILIIPQLFLGGLIRPFKFFADTLHISDFILQKWAFKALLAFDSMGQNILVQMTDMDNRDPLKYITFSDRTLVDVFFGNPSSCILLPCSLSENSYTMLMIFLHAMIPLMLTYIWMRKKYA